MTRMFLLNLFLALVYVALVGDPNEMNFLIGFLLGALVVTLYCRAVGMSSYPKKFFRLLRFAWYFMRILVKANLEVAWEIITPGFHMTPRIIRYDVSDLTEVQLTTLANAISLTPGTLSMDVSDDGHYLYIHAMYVSGRNLDAVRDEIKNGFEKRILELFS